jgi:hypothetical protein
LFCWIVFSIPFLATKEKHQLQILNEFNSMVLILGNSDYFYFPIKKVSTAPGFMPVSNWDARRIYKLKEDAPAEICRLAFYIRDSIGGTVGRQISHSDS